MTTSPNRKYIPEIDQVRGLAALLILFYHGFYAIGTPLEYHGELDPLKHWVIARDPAISVIAEGHSAVGLFIVLSGFVLSLGTIGRQIHYGRFLTARILRIYPLLLVCWITTITTHPTDLIKAIAELLPLETSNVWHHPLTGMFWAVAVEFQCYLVFPFLARFADRYGARFLFQILAVALVLRLMAVFSEAVNPQYISYATVVGRIDQFVIGMLLARAYALHGWDRRVRGIWFAVAAPGVVIMLWAFNQTGGWPVISNWKLIWQTVEGISWAAFLLCYLQAGQRLPRMVAAPLTRLGEISYSVYLLHASVLNLIIVHGWYIQVTHVPYYDALLTTAVVAFPIVIVIAVLFYNTIELPFLRLRPRYVE